MSKDYAEYCAARMADERVDLALNDLRRALIALKGVSPRAADKVRAAISSAKGAKRHAINKFFERRA